MTADLRVVDPDERASDRHRREAYASATEWTIVAAETHHCLIDRTTKIMRKRSTRWSWSVLAVWRLHVLENPACPRCKQVLRRERIRDRRLHGQVPS